MAKTKYTIDDMQALAQKNNGKCLSKKYISSKKKLKWKCAIGHKWDAAPNNIRNGQWCPRCVGRGYTKEEMLEQFQILAKERGGKCLSYEYKNAKTKLNWECGDCKYKWESTPSSIRNGTWCPKCANNLTKSIDDMQKLAKDLGGKCLSEEYVNSKTYLIWECEKGHQWKARPANVQTGYWCPHCSGTIKKTIEDMQEIAKERGGLCLSTEYHNSKQELEWECINGHRWKSPGGNIRMGSWCPHCNINYGEEIVREYFNKIFKCQFVKARPDFLRFSQHNLELDGYNSELKLAFEHQGQQHYKKIKMFHEDDSAFKKQQERDDFKRKKCNEIGIVLFEIPEVPSLTKVEDIFFLIKELCKERKVTFPKIQYKELINQIDFKSIYQCENYEFLMKLSQEKGGKLASPSYLGNLVNLEWECQNGHRWNARPKDIKNGSWCHKCLGKGYSNEELLEQLNNIAIKRGGKCLSLKHIDSRQHLKWQCGLCDHKWEATPTNIRRGRWCPECARFNRQNWKRLDIKEMNEIAKKRGGKCTSEEYINANEKLSWECKFGHTWFATPGNIKSGKWCAKCVGKGYSEDDNLQKLKNIAKERGGKCLSIKYKNTRTKLVWECGDCKHKWESTPTTIKKGCWCPKCAKKSSGSTQRLNIEEMKKIAAKRGGKCLSEKYVNNRTKLRWMCEKGHRWSSSYSNIQQGRWCIKCSKKEK